LLLYELEIAIKEISRVGQNSYIMVESYRNDNELFNLQCWALTCQSFLSEKEWVWLFDKFNYKTKLGWLLGFRKYTQYTLPPSGGSVTPGTTASGTGITSESIVDLNGPRYLYIVVDEFSKGNQNSFISPLSNSIINKNILARLSFDTKTHPLGSILSASIINGKLLSDRRSYTGKIDIQKLKVQIVNEYGNPMNLNGLDFSFCLEVEHE
jgi:hypothetical protein